MIPSLIRFCILGTLVMSAAYVLAKYYISSTLREELEAEWEELPHSCRGPSRGGWVDERMMRSRRAIQNRAALIAFAIPIFSVIAIILAVNFT